MSESLWYLIVAGIVVVSECKLEILLQVRVPFLVHLSISWITLPHVHQSLGQSLYSRLEVFESILTALVHTESIPIAEPHFDVGFGARVPGCFAVVQHGCFRLLRHAVPTLVHHSQIIVCIWIILFLGDDLPAVRVDFPLFCF